tara:strand:+ start:3131 stop:5569 length:2439 start_codon:yes stop_codon:yes gene_type:complete
MADNPLKTPEAIVESTPLEILVTNPEEVAIETEDGGLLIDFDPDAVDFTDNFNDNLAEFMQDSSLDELASDLVSNYISDKDSRSDWEETYIKGLDQLGLKIEDRTTPWDGACGVFHPLLTEAVVRFQAQAITEVFPPKGPVRTQVVGTITREKEQQATRVKDYLNYLLTDRMTEYRTETEKLLFNLPLAGSAFRKVYFDPSMNRPCSMFVPAEDFVVSYGASDLTTCERATHIMKKTPNEVRKLQVNGFYRDIELSTPSEDLSDIQEKYNKLTGDSTSYDYDNRHTLLEMMVDLDLEEFPDLKDGMPTGIALPYIVTIDFSSRKILSIRRNWYEQDEQKMSRQHFVHYQYLPGLGFYGFGLIHLIGGIAKSATSLLRQLVDAGTLSNLPGGLKSRGLRIKGDDTPIMPGEFRDVDVPGGAIRDNITFLPYKEPSGVLYQLLDNLVEEGRRFASVADMKVADMNNQAPVGTTLAILERSMKVMGSVQARIHASMKKELNILSGIIRDFGPTEYPYQIEGQELLPSDFDDEVDVIPVSDPNASTTAQRIMQYQAALQLAQQSPQMYNMAELHRQMLETLGIRDPESIVPLEEDIEPTNPVSENMNMLNEKPVKAFLYQDHEAHIRVHMAMADDPKIRKMIGQSKNANAILGAFTEHVTEHLAFQYRKEIEDQLGVPLPPPDEPLPEDIELRLSQLVSEAAQRVLHKDIAEERQKEVQEKLKDPVIQQRDRELDIREAQLKAKMQTDAQKIVADLQKSKITAGTELERLASQERITSANIAARLATDEAEISSKEKIEGAKIGEKIASDILNKEK